MQQQPPPGADTLPEKAIGLKKGKLLLFFLLFAFITPKVFSFAIGTEDLAMLLIGGGGGLMYLVLAAAISASKSLSPLKSAPTQISGKLSPQPDGTMTYVAG